MDADRLHHLNPVASLVVELCDGTRDLDALRETLLPLVGEDRWPACRAWLDAAIESGLVNAEGETPNALQVVSAQTLTELAATLRDQDQVLPAFICQQRATELTPEDPELWYGLGELAHIVGRRDEARAAYERYLEHHPDDAEIGHILKALRNEDPPPRASNECIERLYARFASFYDANMSGDLEYRGPTLLCQAVTATLGRPRRLNVLDLGCGTGLSGRALQRLARRLVGVDLSRPMIARARKRGVYDVLYVAEITTFLRGEGRSAGRPRRGETFDLVVACDTFIYFGDLRQVLLPAARRLTPDGLVAFTVEQGDRYPFKLTDSGRFSHHADHIKDVAAEAGLSVAGLEEAVLRYEYGNPVPGLVAVLAQKSVK